MSTADLTVALASPLFIGGVPLQALAFRQVEGGGYALIEDEPPPELELALRAPITIAGTTIDSIKLREPKSGEIEKAANAGPNEMAIGIMLVATIAGVAPPFIREMGARDFTRATEYLGRFR